MNKLTKISWKILSRGGWVPLLVFAIHVFLSALRLYRVWPALDIPMHFSGGLAIAFFISQCFRSLPRQSVSRGRVALLELLLIGSLTVSVAVFWEFAEFAGDQIFKMNSQVSLANTMQDLAMGTLGACVLILIRLRQLHVGISEVREITFDWMRGQTA